MNIKSLLTYKISMQKLATVFLILFLSVAANADIKAVWAEKDKKTEIHSFERYGEKYISIAELSRFLECKNVVDIRKGTGTLIFANGDLNYTLFSPYIIAGDKSYNIQYDIMLYYGDFYAPVKNLIPVIDIFMSDDLVYSAYYNDI